MQLPNIEATYLARACGPAQFEESGNNNMQIAIPMEVVEEGEHYGATITWFATLHDKPDSKGKTGKDRVIEALVYMGFQGDDITALMEISDAEAMTLLPEMVSIVCAPDVYNGVERLKVKWVNRAGSGRAGFKKPLSKDAMRSFSAQMRSSLKNARGPGASRPSSNGSRPAQPHPNAPSQGGGSSNDDVPFGPLRRWQ